MNSKFCFLILLLSIIWFGCGRLDGDTLVEGQVVNAYSGKAIPHAWIAIYGNDPNSGSSWSWGSGSSSKFITEKQTDASGKFGFQFESEFDGPYEIIAGMNQLYWNGYTEQLNVNAKRNNKGLKVKFKQPWPISFHLKDVPPQTNMMVRISDLFPPGKDQFYNHRDTILHATVMPIHKNYSIYYTLNDYSTGQYQRIQKELNFPVSEDTIRIEINY